MESKRSRNAETLCFFVEERVSGQGGGPEDGAGEATEFHSWLWEVTRDETVVPGANACAHGKDAQITSKCTQSL